MSRLDRTGAPSKGAMGIRGITMINSAGHSLTISLSGTCGVRVILEFTTHRDRSISEAAGLIILETSKSDVCNKKNNVVTHRPIQRYFNPLPIGSEARLYPLSYPSLPRDGNYHFAFFCYFL